MGVIKQFDRQLFLLRLPEDVHQFLGIDVKRGTRIAHERFRILFVQLILNVRAPEKDILPAGIGLPDDDPTALVRIFIQRVPAGFFQLVRGQ